MPQGNAILDCSPIAAAGHVIPQSYVRISVSQFMDDLAEFLFCLFSWKFCFTFYSWGVATAFLEHWLLAFLRLTRNFRAEV